jgi:hypothetical protein
MKLRYLPRETGYPFDMNPRINNAFINQAIQYTLYFTNFQKLQFNAITIGTVEQTFVVINGPYNTSIARFVMYKEHKFYRFFGTNASINLQNVRL